MTSYRRRRSAGPSNRLSHGLASRYAAEQRRGDAEALAASLRGDAPAGRDLLEASISLAEAILQLRAVRAARLRLLAEAEHMGTGMTWAELMGEPDPDPDLDAIGGEGHVREVGRLTAVLATRQAEFRRLDEYERKSASRRASLVRRLDYLLLESQRATSNDRK